MNNGIVENKANLLANNQAVVEGMIEGEVAFAYESRGRKYYTFFLSVSRLSSTSDILPVTIPDDYNCFSLLHDGLYVRITGQFRSRNIFDGVKRRLILYLYAWNVDFPDAAENIAYGTDNNWIRLKGCICKPPVYRKTPLGREITDIIVAVNRSFRRSDYIPCICWGMSARQMASAEIGEQFFLEGRIQSRIYFKKISDTELENRTAYEVSVFRLHEYREEAV